MSTTIEQAFQTQYEAEVFTAFQRMGALLASTARTGDVRGNTVRWRKVGKGLATQKARHAPVIPMNVDHSYVEGSFDNYYAPEYLDKADIPMTNINERQVLVNAGAYAIGRKLDDILLTALKKGSADIAHGSVGMTMDKIFEVEQRMNDADIPNDGERYGVLPPKAFRDLNLGTGGGDSTLKALYSLLARGGNDSPPLTPQMYFTIPGSTVKWYMHTGTPKASSTWSCLAWHKSVAGLNYTGVVSAEISYIPERVAWLFNHGLTAVGKRIDDTGVIQFEMQ